MFSSEKARQEAIGRCQAVVGGNCTEAARCGGPHLLADVQLEERRKMGVPMAWHPTHPPPPPSPHARTQVRLLPPRPGRVPGARLAALDPLRQAPRCGLLAPTPTRGHSGGAAWAQAGQKTRAVLIRLLLAFHADASSLKEVEACEARIMEV